MEILKAENIDKTYNNSLIDKIHLEKRIPFCVELV